MGWAVGALVGAVVWTWATTDVEEEEKMSDSDYGADLGSGVNFKGGYTVNHLERSIGTAALGERRASNLGGFIVDVGQGRRRHVVIAIVSGLLARIPAWRQRSTLATARRVTRMGSVFYGVASNGAAVILRGEA
jgi:hypothetical protein